MQIEIDKYNKIITKKIKLNPFIDTQDNLTKKQIQLLKEELSFYITDNIGILIYIIRKNLGVKDVTCKRENCNNQVNFIKNQNKFGNY